MQFSLLFLKYLVVCNMYDGVQWYSFVLLVVRRSEESERKTTGIFWGEIYINKKRLPLFFGCMKSYKLWVLPHNDIKLTSHCLQWMTIQTVLCIQHHIHTLMRRCMNILKNYIDSGVVIAFVYFCYTYTLSVSRFHCFPVVNINEVVKQGWELVFSHRASWETETLVAATPISWTQFCSVLIWSLYKFIDVAPHSNPSLGKLISHLGSKVIYFSHKSRTWMSERCFLQIYCCNLVNLVSFFLWISITFKRASWCYSTTSLWS